MRISQFKKYIDGKRLSYYPSSGLDFKDLYFLGQSDFVANGNVFANELVNFDFVPDLFIKTDSAYSKQNWPLNDLGEIYSDEIVSFSLDLVEDFSLDGIDGKRLIIDLELKKEAVKFSKEVLFFFSDNKDFLLNVFLKNHIQIDFMINIRDGFSENGGSQYNMRFSELFLSLLNCKYFISDNTGRDLDKNDILKNEELLNYFNNKKNTQYILKGLKEFSWSEHGVFCGDALLYEVQKLF